MLWIALDELLMTTWDCSYDVKKKSNQIKNLSQLGFNLAKGTYPRKEGFKHIPLFVVLAVKWKPVLLDKLGRLMGLSYGDADV